MTPFEREALREAKKIMSNIGGDCRYEPPVRGHGRLVVILNGKERFTPLSRTPGRAVKALHYKMGDVRRIARELKRDA